MALPETAPEVPLDQQITEVPLTPEIPTHLEQAGVTSVPSTPAPVQGDSKTTTQPVLATPSGPSTTIPASQASLTQMAKGDAANSQTWFGVFWLRKIKQAIKDGLEVIFGKQ